MQKVKALRPGSTLGVVAPASDVSEESVRQGATELERLGFRVVLTDSLYSRHHYFAGLHTDRARQFMNFFEDPRIDGVVCARGGYGSVHLLHLLDPESIRRASKALIGYSDITVLLQFLEQQCSLVCFHGPMLAREFALGETAYDKQVFLDVLGSTQPGLEINCSHGITLRGGKSRGPLTGGCLSLLTASLGTSYEFQTKGKILFLEDVNTKPYQIDRMLMQLKLAGKFETVRGVLWGEMLGCVQGPQQDYRLPDIVMEILQEYNFPILYGVKSGHTSSRALTLPFGVEVELDADRRTLRLEEAPTI